MPDGLRVTLNLLLVPAVVVGLWTLATLRNTKPVTYIGKWREADGWHTGDPYAAPGRTMAPDDVSDDPKPDPRPAALVDVSDLYDDEADGN